MDDLTEEELDLLEPAPDIHTLFVHYNKLYFEAKLGACSVEWSSSRMTSCGGTCELVGGGAGGARIKLSEPLLKLRPTRDLKEVLLHEMTHAYMMLQGIRDDDRGGHGTIFKSIIQRINTSRLPDHQRPPGGYNVAVYHTMLAEVDHYRQHHWQCERCGNLVKRAMNRPPQEADCRGRMGRGADCRDPDCRFHMHQKHCGGVWIKVKEPEGYQQKGKKRGDSSAASANNNSSSASNPGGSRSSGTRPDGVPLPAKRPKKGGSGLPASAAAGTRAITDYFGGSRRGKQTGAEAAAAAVHGQWVGAAISNAELNAHIDECLNASFL
ncbi:sprT-like domain-containing Spartan [Chlorella sorokiniana]|uniref:SprT-like domain-containing Spartan n=1 Tax=Chlorella sorokiniana TaxID=3076 RepID=A0A2P6TE25_CHLSO|nr:sprT-like domain-containing Spartan [Chlorella sorokiniana]|eukprot:PRW20898.1 sprT-like domain-containing Spartan [Chlorella sorokiniana]